MLKKRFALFDRLTSAPIVPRPPSSDDADALIQAASAAQDRQEWEAAHALWQEATQRRPESINCWLQLGNMRNELARYKPAIMAFEAARALDPHAAEPLAGIAGVQERAAAWETALATWNALVALLEDPARAARPTDQERRVHAFLHAALSASMGGQRALAQDIILDATRRVPGFAELPGHLLMRARAVR